MKYSASDLTLAIMAYRESPFLEEAVQSILNQTVTTQIIISTSTPNDYIRNIGEKYHIPIYVNTGIGDACDNFNFAFSKSKTELVTLVHQDDIYRKDFAEEMLKALNEADDPIIAFSDSAELRGTQITSTGALLKIKRVMSLPVRIKQLRNRVWAKRLILSFGNAICCPSVTFVKHKVKMPVFTPGYISNIDWQAWEKLSKLEGSFVYVNKKILIRRIHEASATSQTIADKVRRQEDMEMFKVFWPHWFAKILLGLYSLSEISNRNQEK